MYGAAAGESRDMSALLGRLSRLGVCRTGRRYLERTEKDFDTLVKVWRGWPDFLGEHAEEALPILRRYLTADDKICLAERHLYVDHVGMADVTGNTYPVFVVGDSDVRLTIPEYGVVKLYVFNNAHVTCDMGYRAILNIETYNTASVTLMDGCKGRSTCYCYDDSSAHGVEKTIRKEYRRGEVFNGKELKERRK